MERNLNECLGSEEWAIKYYENNEADICTWSEGGEDLQGNKIVDGRIISNKLIVELCINGSTLGLGNNNNL